MRGYLYSSCLVHDWGLSGIECFGKTLPRMVHFIALPSVLQGCNLAHVLGLFRITGAHTAACALGARGALADMALWAIARLQTRLFASRTFVKCAFGPDPSSKGHKIVGFNLLFWRCYCPGVDDAHASMLSSISVLL